MSLCISGSKMLSFESYPVNEKDKNWGQSLLKQVFSPILSLDNKFQNQGWIIEELIEETNKQKTEQKFQPNSNPEK